MRLSPAIPGKFLESVRDFLHPPECVLCHQPVHRTRHVCVECESALPLPGEDACRRCGAPVGPFLSGQERCQHCRKDRFAFEAVFAGGVYRGLLKQLCLEAKQPAGIVAAQLLSRRVIARWGDELQKQECDVIVPVPQHWTSRVTRVVWVPDEMSRVLGRFLKVPVDSHILRKIRRTRAQSTLTPTDRRRNLGRAFAVSRGVRLDGSRILLVDDVLTTGTTAHQAAQTLRRGGARSVIVVAGARGLGQ